jgi:hypothetical protein
MADIKFACPHCQQHITCDELWGGHELKCPSCQNPLTVPAPPAAPPAPVPTPSLAAQPPVPAAARLSLGQVGGHSAAQKPAPQQRAIPIRNLAAPPPKKGNPVVKYATTAVVLVGLGIGGYYGFLWLHGMQQRANAKNQAEEAKNSGESQVGHIANLNAVLDATEPGHFPGQSEGSTSGPRARSSGVGREIALGAPGEPNASTTDGAAQPQLPVVAPVWTLDLMQAKIPASRVNGMLAGTNFVADSARLEPSATAHVLAFIQGAPTPERELLVYLHLKPGETLGGQTLEVTSDMRGGGIPSIAKLWKTNPRYAPTTKFFSGGYALRLEFGAVTNNTVPGKIFAALPDPEQTVVAGSFVANMPAPQPAYQATPTVTPLPVAAPSGAAADAYRRRYGGR